MAFHIGKHKAIGANRDNVRLPERAKFAGLGSECLGIGLLGLSRIGLVYLWLFLPVGIALVVLAFIPWSWMDKPARRLLSIGEKTRPPRRGH